MTKFGCATNLVLLRGRFVWASARTPLQRDLPAGRKGARGGDLAVGGARWSGAATLTMRDGGIALGDSVHGGGGRCGGPGWSWLHGAGGGRPAGSRSDRSGACWRHRSPGKHSHYQRDLCSVAQREQTSSTMVRGEPRWSWAAHTRDWPIRAAQGQVQRRRRRSRGRQAGGLGDEALGRLDQYPRDCWPTGRPVYMN